MNAKEMFEILGYTYEYYVTPIYSEFDKNNGAIWFTRNKGRLSITIRFFLKSKRWMIDGDYSNGVHGGIHGNVDLFLAIQQQMKELEWIE